MNTLRSLGSNLRYRDRKLLEEGQIEEVAERIGRRYRVVNRIIAVVGAIVVGLVLVQIALGRPTWIGIALAALAAFAIAYTYRQQRQIQRVLDTARNSVEA